MKSMKYNSLKGLLIFALGPAGWAPPAAGAETFAVDPAQSRVAVSGYVLGTPLTEQGSGSLSAAYGGALMVDMSTNSIQFGAGSHVSASDSGLWQPLPDGSAGSAPANYGGFGVNFVASGMGAVRNAHVEIASGALAIVNGQFDARPLTFTIPTNSRSSVAYRVDGAYRASGAIALAGQSASGAATTGTIATAGGQQTITIPIHFTMHGSLAVPNDTALTLTGQLVGVRSSVAAPAPAVEALTAPNTQ